MANLETHKTLNDQLAGFEVFSAAEHQLAQMIHERRELHHRRPSVELEREIEKLEGEHTLALERVYELKRIVRPHHTQTA